jgi:hypothetical protein
MIIKINWSARGLKIEMMKRSGLRLGKVGLNGVLYSVL